MIAALLRRLDAALPVGPRSVLWGAHCAFIHPWFVAAAWWRLYGAPRDPRLWVAFFVHDLGYLVQWCPNMDGPEGKAHVHFGADVLHALFDRRDQRWRDFGRLHSRSVAESLGRPVSRLAVADKLAVALEPWWLYMPRVVLSGELAEYRADLAGWAAAHPGDDPIAAAVRAGLAEGTLRGWHRALTANLRAWVESHGREAADGVTIRGTGNAAADGTPRRDIFAKTD